MYTQEEATEERVAAYVAALQQERLGYEQRLRNAKDGRQEALTARQLEKRIADVDAEIERASGEKPKPKRASAGKRPAAKKEDVGGAAEQSAADTGGGA